MKRMSIVVIMMFLFLFCEKQHQGTPPENNVKKATSEQIVKKEQEKANKKEKQTNKENKNQEKANNEKAKEKKVEHTLKDFVAAYAELECALAKAKDRSKHQEITVEILKKHDYTLESYLADKNKFGTKEAELEKEKCMPKKEHTMEDFVKTTVEIECALAKEDDASKHDAIKLEILKKHDYTLEEFVKDQQKYGSAAEEKISKGIEECAPKQLEPSKMVILEIATKINCVNRTNISKQDKEEYKKLILEEYNVSPEAYENARKKYASDKDFIRSLNQALKNCPRVVTNIKKHKKIKKHGKKHVSKARFVSGKYAGKAYMGKAVAIINFSIFGGKFSNIKVKFGKNIYNVGHVKLVGKQIFANNSYPKGQWIKIKGKAIGTFFRGEISCRINGKVYKGKWTARRQ